MEPIATKKPAYVAASMWRWQIAVPPEKGAWIWWIGPLLIGIVAGGKGNVDLVTLFIAVLVSFLLRQPFTLLVKIHCKRHSRRDMASVRAWLTIYSTILLFCAVMLLSRGHTWMLGLAALIAPVFIWHGWLVTQGDERHQPLLSEAVAFLAASAAPAAYWVCQEPGEVLPWVLWLLTWLQSSASITHMFLRLQQRRLKEVPSIPERWRMGALPFAHHLVNVILAVWMMAIQLVPVWVAIAFGVTLVEGVMAVTYPPVGHTPRQLGMRQLMISCMFILFMILGFLSW